MLREPGRHRRLGHVGHLTLDRNYEKDFHGCVPLLGNWTMVPTVKGKKDKSLPLGFDSPAVQQGLQVGFITSNAPHGLFMAADTFNFKLGATPSSSKNTRVMRFGSIDVRLLHLGSQP